MATRMKPAECCAPIAVKPLADAESKRIAKLAKALADPNRVQILRLIAKHSGPVCACDVVDFLDLSQPTVSHHLGLLKRAGLLRSDRRGLWNFYSLDPAGGAALEHLPGLLER